MCADRGHSSGSGFRPFGCVHFEIKTGQEGEERLVLISPDIATASKVGILVDEQIGVRQEVRGVCDLPGFDPCCLANEGKLVAFVPEVKAKTIPEAVKTHPLGRDDRARLSGTPPVLPESLDYQISALSR